MKGLTLITRLGPFKAWKPERRTEMQAIKQAYRIWMEASPRKRQAILSSLGYEFSEATEFAQEEWDALPNGLRGVLIRETEHTGEPD